MNSNPEQISTTPGNGSPNSTNALAGRLGRHFAAAAACTVVAGSASSQAAVVNSGMVNLNVPATTAGLYLNVVTGANGVSPAAVPGWDVNPWSATGFGLFSPTSPAGGVYDIIATNVVANLTIGAVVDGSASFGSNGSTNTSQWNLNSSNNYIGFRFLNEGTAQVHYGWMQVEFGATYTTRSIVGYAYDDTPGTGVTVTAIVPEPGSAALLGWGGVVFLRRRR